MLFNSKEDFYDYNEYLKTLPISEDSVFKIRNFLKFSPNKFARKIGINEEEFQKEFNQLKKPLHLKLLYYKKIISLKDYRPELGIFEKFINLGSGKESYWVKVELRKSMCICIESFKRHGDPTFYETIYYSYCLYDNRYFLFDSNDRSIELNSNEFNHYFIDYRDWAIGKILS
jgi:hypothetical protein